MPIEDLKCWSLATGLLILMQINPARPMKKLLLLGCLALTVPAVNVVASDTLPAVHVESSRALKMAIANVDRDNPLNDQLSSALAESLGFAISERCKMPVPVKPITGKVQDLANGLANGRYDFVVLIGTKVPSGLTSSDFVRLKAVPASGNSNYVINLVLRNSDEAFTDAMKQSFPEALKGVFFQKVLARHSNLAATGEIPEWKVALAVSQ
jgi:hypothetical protein